MKAIIKISWKKNSSGDWYAKLLTRERNQINSIKLSPQRKLEFEITERRKCIGYISEIGKRKPCPEFRDLEKGSQCFKCRKKDIYKNYIEGRQKAKVDSDFSVYLAQCGEEIKVGVTRSGRIKKRWIEQGAEYAVEIYSGISSNEALSKEKEISEKGIKQRIRKENKLKRGKNSLNEVLKSIGFQNKNIISLSDKTIYPDIKCDKLYRKGRFSGKINSVKGQIISNKRICIVAVPGKTIINPNQKGLEDYN